LAPDAFRDLRARQTITPQDTRVTALNTPKTSDSDEDWAYRQRDSELAREDKLAGLRADAAERGTCVNGDGVEDLV
jgi:hypothetical protein